MSAEDTRRKLRAMGAKVEKARVAHQKAEEKYLMLKAKAEVLERTQNLKNLKAEEAEEKLNPELVRNLEIMRSGENDNPDYKWYVIGYVHNPAGPDSAWILAGNEYRQDANDVLKEMKENGIQAKVVHRDTLMEFDTDPRDDSNWKNAHELKQ
jgi:hypothetical protein